MQESPSPTLQTPGLTATLLSASAITGWLDWMHGELWLLPGGLLRIPLDLQTTQLHGMGPTVNREPLDEETLRVLLASQKNVWVPRESIQRAYLHQGRWTDRLRLSVGNHRSIKFLWFPWDGAWQPLHATLTAWLESDLIVD